MSTAIKIENISKVYRLGMVSRTTMKEDLKRFYKKLTKGVEPLYEGAIANNRNAKEKSDYVWSLKDINLEIKQGEVIGIIGKNGAGKSTLLKILSRVTQPTTGSIKYNGRIASLLEVGTGFHPELTGRENIFLNGAILGMTKSEIKRKFDEIVEFSGVGNYLDTPVKRYSSGMYVRLAFAVAAHLEPEILIIDEVLAVGDAEFQKKCLGKMKSVSGEGRTVLFVQ
jgi:lipopolysaccharide transport system ATP-binding protein